MICKDCLAEGLVNKRPIVQAGRCATHHRAVTKARRNTAHARRLAAVYSITTEEYEAILATQGGRCAICQRATGAHRRLAVDHDHACCNGPTSCGRCVRGLLCSTCNKTLGHLRDAPEAFERGAAYLKEWPSGRGPHGPPPAVPGAAPAA